MSKKHKTSRQEVVLDKEEKAILASFDRGEWKSVNNLDDEKSRLQKAAIDYLRKDRGQL